MPPFYFLTAIKRLLLSLLLIVGTAHANNELQEHDSTCGAAALRYLLNASGEKKFTEDEILQEARVLFNYKLGGSDFSVSQIELMAIHFGFVAKAAKIPFELIPRLNQPIVILLSDKRKNIRHFVVVEKVRNNIAYMFDPTLGPVRVSIEELKEMSADEAALGLIAIGVKSKLPNEKFNLPIDLISLSVVDSTYNKYRRAMLLANNKPANPNQTGIIYGYNSQTIRRPIVAVLTTSSLGLKYGLGDEKELIFGYTNTVGLIDEKSENFSFKSQGVSLGINKWIPFNDGSYSAKLGFNLASDNDGGKYFTISSLLTGVSSGIGYFVSGDASYQNSFPKTLVALAFGVNFPISDYILLSGIFSSKRAVLNNKSSAEAGNTIGFNATYLVSKKIQVSGFSQWTFISARSSSMGISVSYMGGW